MTEIDLGDSTYLDNSSNSKHWLEYDYKHVVYRNKKLNEYLDANEERIYRKYNIERCEFDNMYRKVEALTMMPFYVQDGCKIAKITIEILRLRNDTIRKLDNLMYYEKENGKNYDDDSTPDNLKRSYGNNWDID